MYWIVSLSFARGAIFLEEEEEVQMLPLYILLPTQEHQHSHDDAVLASGFRVLGAPSIPHSRESSSSLLPLSRGIYSEPAVEHLLVLLFCWPFVLEGPPRGGFCMGLPAALTRVKTVLSRTK